MRRRFGVVTIVAVVALAAAAIGLGSPTQRQLASFRGYAYSFGGGGGRVGWIDTTFNLRLRPLSSSTVSVLRYTSAAHEAPNYPSWQQHLVLSRTGELWWSTTHTPQAFDSLDRVLFASRGATKPSTLLKVSHNASGGTAVAGIAGDAAGFAYGEAVVEATTPDDVAFHVTGGGVFSVDARGKPTRLADAPPAYVLARGAGRVVDEPVATDVNESAELRPSNVIEVRNVSDGGLVRSFSVAGVRAAAVTRDTVALLVGRTLRRYRIGDGTELPSTALPPSTAPELETDGMIGVARSSRSIVVVNLTTGRLRALAIPTPWHPTGVAVTGGAVVWSESRGRTPAYPSVTTFTTRILCVKIASL